VAAGIIPVANRDRKDGTMAEGTWIRGAVMAEDIVRTIVGAEIAAVSAVRDIDSFGHVESPLSENDAN